MKSCRLCIPSYYCSEDWPLVSQRSLTHSVVESMRTRTVIFRIPKLYIMSKLMAIHLAYANWCPHCVPTAVEPVERKAQELGVACRLYDLDDSTALKKADELVKDYGDWSDDYLIPQIFLEYDTGDIRHVFTGYSEDVQLTRRGLNSLLASPLLKSK